MGEKIGQRSDVCWKKCTKYGCTYFCLLSKPFDACPGGLTREYGGVGAVLGGSERSNHFYFKRKVGVR
jgi:hypothetical protein